MDGNGVCMFDDIYGKKRWCEMSKADTHNDPFEKACLRWKKNEDDDDDGEREVRQIKPKVFFLLLELNSKQIKS